MLQPIPSKPEADPAEILHLDQSDKGSLFRIWRKGCLQYSHQNPAEVAEFLMGRICAYLAGHSRQGLVFHAAAVSRAGRGIMLAGHSRQGLVFHTAAVSRAGRGIMLAGPTGAGKSTLTAYLLDGGYGCLSDELVFIRQGVLEF